MEKILQAVIKAVITELAKAAVKSINDYVTQTYSKNKGDDHERHSS